MNISTVATGNSAGIKAFLGIAQMSKQVSIGRTFFYIELHCYTLSKTTHNVLIETVGAFTFRKG